MMQLFEPAMGIKIPLAEGEAKLKVLITEAAKVGDCWECHRTPSQIYPLVRFGKVLNLRVSRLVLFVCEPWQTPDVLALHTCDNPTCIRFDHIFGGTNADNAADRDNKGRGKFVLPAPVRKVSDIEVRTLHESGLSTTEIARRLNVTHKTIWQRIHPNGDYHDAA